MGGLVERRMAFCSTQTTFQTNLTKESENHSFIATLLAPIFGQIKIIISWAHRLVQNITQHKTSSALKADEAFQRTVAQQKVSGENDAPAASPNAEKTVTESEIKRFLDTDFLYAARFYFKNYDDLNQNKDFMDMINRAYYSIKELSCTLNLPPLEVTNKILLIFQALWNRTDLQESGTFKALLDNSLLESSAKLALTKDISPEAVVNKMLEAHKESGYIKEQIKSRVSPGIIEEHFYEGEFNKMMLPSLSLAAVQLMIEFDTTPDKAVDAIIRSYNAFAAKGFHKCQPSLFINSAKLAFKENISPETAVRIIFAVNDIKGYVRSDNGRVAGGQKSVGMDEELMTKPVNDALEAMTDDNKAAIKISYHDLQVLLKYKSVLENIKYDLPKLTEFLPD
jgi:hypothetical protein